MAPQLICGTATFGMDLTEFQNQDSVNSLLRTLRGLGVERLDSGARYPPLNPGRSEMLIGYSKEFCKGFIIDTKVYTNTQTDGSGDLTRAGISKSLTGSLQRLQINEGVRHLHMQFFRMVSDIDLRRLMRFMHIGQTRVPHSKSKSRAS
jgi:aflatoxin B1 aldehyde reductase